VRHQHGPVVRWEPDWCIRPGVTLAEVMEVRHLDVPAAALLCDVDLR
jgi:hypothetical protein